MSNSSSEEELLNKFLSFANEHQGNIYIGWNLKDTTYGIQMIQNRINEIIGDHRIPIDNNEIYDLDDILEKKYGMNYMSDPKLRNLAKYNKLTLLGFMDGLRECDLFDTSNYRPIELSTNRKVRIISNLFMLLLQNKLQVENKSLKLKIIEFIKDPIVSSIIGIISVLLAILGILIAL